MGRQRGHCWCFTINNYGEDTEREICDKFAEFARYGVIGREVGREGTRHLQGYVIFKDRASFRTALSRISAKAHIEQARGSPEDNFRYCSKGGVFREVGERPGGNFRVSEVSGNNGRSSRELVSRSFASALDRGRSGLSGFIESSPGTWYFHGHNLMRNYCYGRPSVARPGTVVWWYYGAPGVGKSRRAHLEMPDAYVKDPRTKWWNGYLFESDVIIDDLGPDGIDINHLLRWFDVYKCNVESKGGMLPLYATKFIVTSNFHPSEVYRKKAWSFGESQGYEEHPQLPALLRRLNLLEMF